MRNLSAVNENQDIATKKYVDDGLVGKQDSGDYLEESDKGNRYGVMPLSDWLAVEKYYNHETAYVVCDTEANAETKEITIDSTYRAYSWGKEGALLAIKFYFGNTHAYPNLKINNGTTTIPIRYKSATLSEKMIPPNMVALLINTGTFFDLLNPDISTIFSTISSTSPTQTINLLADNTEYTYNAALSSLTITAVPIEGYETCIRFSSGSAATTLNFPASIKWAGGNAPTMKASKTYEISIKNNLALIAEY